jgi:hypothetical protein
MMEEEFLDYKKLLGDMAADPTLVTLSCLLSLAAAPSSSKKNDPGLL